MNLKWSVLFFTLAIAGCSTELPQDRVHASSDDTASSPLLLSHIETRPKISVATDLDEVGFRMNGLRAGLQDFTLSTSPVVTLFIPEQADYAEVMRCSDSLAMQGIFENLSNIELGVSSADEEARLMASNDFWKAASQAGCLLVSTNQSSNMLFDHSAPSGTFRYMARACVDNSRLSDGDLFDNRNCSMQVTATPALTFRNTRQDKTQKALSDAQQAKSIAEGLGRYLFKLTVDLNNALIECDAHEKDRLVAVQRKNAVTTLIGAGLALGSGAVNELNTLSSNDAGGNPNPLTIGGALRSLFTSSADFPKSCTDADEARSNGETATKQIADQQKIYAALMEEASQAQKEQQVVEGK